MTRVYAWFFNFIARILGFYPSFTPKSVLLLALEEPKQLPMGMTEFHQFAKRIGSGANVPGLTEDSIKTCLVGAIMSLKPTEAFVSDGYFINVVRRQAAQEVAFAAFQQIKENQKKKQAEATAPKLEAVAGGLEDTREE